MKARGGGVFVVLHRSGYAPGVARACWRLPPPHAPPSLTFQHRACTNWAARTTRVPSGVAVAWWAGVRTRACPAAVVARGRLSWALMRARRGYAGLVRKEEEKKEEEEEGDEERKEEGGQETEAERKARLVARASKLADEGAAKFDAESIPQALECFRKALRLRIEALGEDHPDVGETHHLVAEALWGLNRFREAETVLRISADIMRKNLGPKHATIGPILKNIGECRHAYVEENQQKLSSDRQRELLLEVLPLMVEAAEISKANATNERDENYLETLYSLGEFYIQLDRYAEALPAFEQAVDYFEEKMGPGSVDTLICLRNLVSCYRALGQMDKLQETEWRIAQIEKQWQQSEPGFDNMEEMRQTMERMGLDKHFAEMQAASQELQDEYRQNQKRKNKTKRKGQ